MTRLRSLLASARDAGAFDMDYLVPIAIFIILAAGMWDKTMTEVLEAILPTSSSIVP